MNWFVESVSVLIVIFTQQKLLIVMYILLNGCVTPIVYVMGIEENRKSAKEVSKFILKHIQKKSKIQPQPNTVVQER